MALKKEKELTRQEEKIIGHGSSEEQKLLAFKTRNPKVLKELSEKDNLFVKICVAGNKYTPPSVKLRFAQEGGIYINEVLLKLYKKNIKKIKQEDIEVIKTIVEFQDSPALRRKATQLLREVEQLI